MKRRKNKGPHRTPKPAWQTIPMRNITESVRGWEVLKSKLDEVGNRPAAIAHLQEWRNGQTPRGKNMLNWLESIVPAARAEIAVWLSPGNAEIETAALESTEAVAADAKETAFLVIVRLWERWLAVGIQGGRDAQLRWLSEKSREEQLLITRLSERITLPTA